MEVSISQECDDRSHWSVEDELWASPAYLFCTVVVSISLFKNGYGYEGPGATVFISTIVALSFSSVSTLAESELPEPALILFSCTSASAALVHRRQFPYIARSQ